MPCGMCASTHTVNAEVDRQLARPREDPRRAQLPCKYPHVLLPRSDGPYSSSMAWWRACQSASMDNQGARKWETPLGRDCSCCVLRSGPTERVGMRNGGATGCRECLGALGTCASSTHKSIAGALGGNINAKQQPNEALMPDRLFVSHKR